MRVSKKFLNTTQFFFFLGEGSLRSGQEFSAPQHTHINKKKNGDYN